MSAEQADASACKTIVACSMYSWGSCVREAPVAAVMILPAHFGPCTGYNRFVRWREPNMECIGRQLTTERVMAQFGRLAGPGKAGIEKRFLDSSCATERGGSTDRGPRGGRHGAHISKIGGGPLVGRPSGWRAVRAKLRLANLWRRCNYATIRRAIATAVVAQRAGEFR